MTIDLKKYKKLTDVQHAILRGTRYLGAVEPSESYSYVVKDSRIEWANLTYSPAFLKMFDEIVSNSVDFSKKPEGKHLNELRVTCNKETGVMMPRMIWISYSPFGQGFVGSFGSSQKVTPLRSRLAFTLRKLLASALNTIGFP